MLRTGLHARRLSLVLVHCLLDITVGSFRDDFGMLASELIDLGFVKFPCTDFVLKEHIKLAVCASLGLRKTEIRPHAKEKASACPEEP